MERSKDYWAVSYRILLIKLSDRTFDVNISQTYVPNAESNEDNIDTFYNDLDNVLNLCRNSVNYRIKNNK